MFEIQPKAFLGRTTLSGPKLKISIQPDATKPTKLDVAYDKGRKYVVSEIFPGKFYLNDFRKARVFCLFSGYKYT